MSPTLLLTRDGGALFASTTNEAEPATDSIIPLCIPNIPVEGQYVARCGVPCPVSLHFRSHLTQAPARLMACEHCTQGYILPGEPTGTMLDGHYYCAAPKGSTKSCAILVLTDIFGLDLKNPKIIADRLARQVRCDVWVPDVFDGT